MGAEGVNVGVNVENVCVSVELVMVTGVGVPFNSRFAGIGVAKAIEMNVKNAILIVVRERSVCVRLSVVAVDAKS